jgi:hypothetical protein
MAINVTISTGGATTVVTVLEVQNNITVSRNQITSEERTKLDGIEAGADVTVEANVRDAGAVMTTGDQTINGTKTFDGPVTFNGGPNDPITIQNNTPVNFNNSSTTFGTGSSVKFEGITPQFNAVTAVHLSGTGNQQIYKNTPGELTVESNSGDVKIVANDGDLILKSGTSSGNKLSLEGRSEIEFKLSREEVEVASVFKIIDTNPVSGDETTILEVDRAGDFIVRDQAGVELFKVQSSPEQGEDLDFIRIGGENGYKFPKPLSDMRNKALVVKDVASGDDFGKLEFRDFVATSIFDMAEVNETSNDMQEGEALIWNDSTNKFVAQSVLSNVGLNDLSDVDTATTSPVNGYALVWSNGTWIPQAQTNTTVLSTDSSPTLSANLDVSTYSILTTSTNQGITIQPNGTGNVSLGNFEFDADQDLTGKDNHVLTYDQGSGTIQLEPAALDLDGLSDVDLTNVSEDDILIRDASGKFVPTDTFSAFMNAAVAATAGMPQNGSVAGDFDNDGIVSTNDLLIFLSNVGASPSDGNTQIEFTDMAVSNFFINESDFTYTDYNTQSTITTGQRGMQQYQLDSPDVTTSITPYTWQVNTTSDSIKLYTSNSTQFGEWFENAVIEIKEPSSIYHNTGVTDFPVSFAVYVEITRDYPIYANETQVKMIADYTSVENLNFLMTQDQSVSFTEAFKKDSTNTERPKAVTLKFYAAFAEDEFGYAVQKFNNLKLKVTGSV